jgi:tRNA(fMet)-specific endonuclease VapC
MHLLDTNIATLIYYGRNDRMIARYELFPDGEVISISPITRAEILRGRLDSLIKAANPTEWLTAQTRLVKAEEWLSGYTLVAIDDAAVEWFDRLVTNKKLKKIGRADLFIALAHDATHVTQNTKDFQAVPNLKLDNWAA